MAGSPEREQRERERLEELRRAVAHHDWRYHVLDDPELADAEYDALRRELVALEAAHPEWADPSSPLHRVGGEPVSDLAEVEHVIPMLSLDNVNSAEELSAFDARLSRLLEREQLEYVAEPKIDGVAVELRYERGALVVGSTRGNGRVGEDVSHNLRTVRALPLRLPAAAPALLEVRGEVFMRNAAFARLNRERLEAGLAAYANPRNSTAGALRQLDPRVGAAHPLDLVVYGVGRGAAELGVRSQHELLERLAALGFQVSEPAARCSGTAELLAFHRALEARREQLPHEIDGTVIKLDDFALREHAGALDRAPRWAVAFKFPPRQASTRVREIRAYVGRTGVLTPVAVLEPVHIGGVTVVNASLHNQDEVERLGVRAGDRVLVERAGDVIPHVIKVLAEDGAERGEPYRLPEHCPECGSQTIRLAEEVALRCPNLQCPAQVKERLRHFVGRGGLDIEGFGEKLLHQLVELGWVHRPSDLFELQAAPLAELERMGEKSAQNLLAARDAASRPALARLLYALGIRHVGARTSRLLAEHFGEWRRIAAASLEELQALHGFGPAIASAVRAFFDDAHNVEELERLSRALQIQAPPPRAETTRLPGIEGRSFVLTGTLSEPRPQLEARLRAAGGKITGSVSKKTDYVVAGADPGSKLAKAQELGVKILDDAGLRALFEGGGADAPEDAAGEAEPALPDPSPTPGSP